MPRRTYFISLGVKNSLLSEPLILLSDSFIFAFFFFSQSDSENVSNLFKISQAALDTLIFFFSGRLEAFYSSEFTLPLQPFIIVTIK